MAGEMTKKTARYYAFKNLFLMNFVVFTIYTAIFPLHDLQTSLYRENGLGYASLLIKYIGVAISSLFFGPYFLDRIGPKYTICIAIIGYLSFVLGNIDGNWFTLMPTGLIFGLGTGLHAVSAASYIKIVALKYSEATGQLESDVFSRFYPLWYTSFKLSQISGSIISSNIMKRPQHTTNRVSFYKSLCGSSICPNTKIPIENVDIKPSQITILVIVSAGFACVSFIAATFLDRMKTTTQPDKPKQKLGFSFLKNLKDYRMLLLTPLAIQTGMQVSFVYADFTKAYVTCYKGIDIIGWTMAVYGVLSAVSSTICSKIGANTGPFYILAVTSVVHVLVLVCLLQWVYVESLYPYMVYAGLLGACDSAWRSQLPVIIRHVFPTRYNEFVSLAIFLESLGFVLYFAFGPFLCVYIKLYIVIGSMILGIVLFGVVYYRQPLDYK